MTALRDGAPYLPGDLPLPPVISTNAVFWKAASEGRLDVQQCRECGAHRHPPTEGCYRCGSLDLDWATLPGTGTVFTYTWVAQPLHPAVESVVPYNVTVVEVGPGTVLSGLVRRIDRTVERLTANDVASLAAARARFAA